MDARRIILFLTTIGFVAIIATAVSLYARGYRYDEKDGLTPKGLLIVKSAPEGAQVYINGEEETVTNDSINLSPGIYSVQVRKDGHISWQKELTIKENEVTEVTAHLFKSAPSLSAITLSGATNPVPSRDFTKLAYFVIPAGSEIDIVDESDEETDSPLPPQEQLDLVSAILTPTPSLPDEDTQGLWVIETVNLPLGFSREPRRITDMDMTNATIVWSPDGREIMIETPTSTYLLSSSEFTPRNQLKPLGASELTETEEVWDLELTKKREAQLAKLPDEFEELFAESIGEASLSPDEDMVLYTATASAFLAEDLVDQLPGSSTQEQQRDIKPGHTYVYDIKEDRNFLIADDASELIIEGGYHKPEATKRLSWFATSRNLVLAEEDRVVIMDSDGTNRQPVYTGSFISPHAFPTVSIDRLMILTNLGATSKPADIYSLSVK